MVSFPYRSHIFRDSYGSGMGIVWEAYQKRVPLLGILENPIDLKLENKFPLKKAWFRSEDHLKFECVTSPKQFNEPSKLDGVGQRHASTKTWGGF